MARGGGRGVTAEGDFSLRYVTAFKRNNKKDIDEVAINGFVRSLVGLN